MSSSWDRFQLLVLMSDVPQQGAAAVALTHGLHFPAKWLLVESCTLSRLTVLVLQSVDNEVPWKRLGLGIRPQVCFPKLQPCMWIYRPWSFERRRIDVCRFAGSGGTFCYWWHSDLMLRTELLWPLKWFCLITDCFLRRIVSLLLRTFPWWRKWTDGFERMNSKFHSFNSFPTGNSISSYLWREIEFSFRKITDLFLNFPF